MKGVVNLREGAAKGDDANARARGADRAGGLLSVELCCWAVDR